MQNAIESFREEFSPDTRNLLRVVMNDVGLPKMVINTEVRWSCFDGQQYCLEYKRHDHEKRTIKIQSRLGKAGSSQRLLSAGWHDAADPTHLSSPPISKFYLWRLVMEFNLSTAQGLNP